MENKLLNQLCAVIKSENGCKTVLRERQLAAAVIFNEIEKASLHIHDYLKFVFQLEGNAVYSIEGKELEMAPGDILLIMQNVPYAVAETDEDASSFCLVARLEFFEKTLKMLQEKRWDSDFLINMMWQNNQTPGYMRFQLGECRFVNNLIENLALAVEHDEGNDILSQYTMGLLLLFLSSKTEHATKDTSRTYKDTIIAETLGYIEVQYRTANLSQIAEEFHQPLPVLSKMIKQETGLTFRELLMNKRFEKAADLLIETNLPVEKVAVNIGYENQSYFHLQFKKRYGVTPRQYRMQRRREISVVS